MALPETENAVARELLAYGQELYAEGQKAGVVVEFTPDDAANKMVLKCPNAFLFAVIFDEGIRAERAWAAPYLLSERLGHFDMARIAGADPDELLAAVARPPALHRYVNKTALRLINAAKLLLRDYAGDAANIWAGEPTAGEVLLRLLAFDGIGQKKAAMAVNILMRDFLIPLRGTAGTEIAYDIHIRRVFMRTGLSERDDPDAFNAAARNANPENPGALDIAAWYAGRNWCHPTSPLCDSCRLSELCPRSVDKSVL